MNRSNVMELVKKNVLSIICGVVALAAIGFHFFYTSGGFEDLRARAEERSRKHDELKTVLNEQRTLPAVNDAPPAPLQQFPSEKIIAAATEVVGKLHSQAEQLMSEAVKINRTGYDLLVPESLPAPNDNRKYEFRQEYNEVLRRGGTPVGYNRDKPTRNLPDEVLKSAVPPTPEEIAAEKVRVWNEQYVPKLIMVNNQPVNLREVGAEFVKKTANFDEDFRRNRAMNHKLYLEPTALAISQRIPLTGQAPAVEDMWYAQMSLWIQQDVARAIAAANAKANNIPSAPVKHLIALNVRQDASMYITKTGPLSPTAAGAPAAPAMSPEGVPLTPADGSEVKNYALSPTGRVCNPTYDVVHFDLVAVVDAEHVRTFLRWLQYGRFINVLETDVQLIDLNEAKDMGYYYGEHPVVELRVKCEALFLREWTVNSNGPMPKTVQAMLGAGLPPPAAPLAPTESEYSGEYTSEQ